MEQWQFGDLVGLWRTAALSLLVATLAGCSSSARNETTLAGACQFKACICVDGTAAFWQAKDTQPVRWRENGDAFCPPPFVLRLTDTRGWQ
jgi:hypothetical protein